MVQHARFVCFVYVFAIAIFIAGELNGVNADSASNVLELNDRFLDVRNEGLWFVEFYAPWCGHCKRLQPIWEQLGNALADSAVRVAKIDCTRFTAVSNAINIHGFPTIKFFRYGVEYDYDGDRTEKALLDFAKKASGPEFKDIIGGRKVFESIQSSHSADVVFVLVTSPTVDNDKLSEEFELLAKEFFTKVFFYRTDAGNLPKEFSLSHLPAILCLKDAAFTTYDLTMNDSLSVRQWLASEQWGAFPEISYGNLYDIGLCCNKLLVLAAVDVVERATAGSHVAKFVALLQKTAKTHSAALSSHFQFGWTDGTEIQDNVIMGTLPVPGFIVLNVSSFEYYYPEQDPTTFTEQSLVAYLQAVGAGSKTPMGGKGFFLRIRRMVWQLFSTVYSMFASQPLLSCCLFGLPIGVLTVICYALCSADTSPGGGEEFPEDSNDSDSDHDKRD